MEKTGCSKIFLNYKNDRLQVVSIFRTPAFASSFPDELKMKKGTARSLKNDKLSVLNCLENNIAFSHNQISGRFIDAKILGFKTQEQQ